MEQKDFADHRQRGKGNFVFLGNIMPVGKEECMNRVESTLNLFFFFFFFFYFFYKYPPFDGWRNIQDIQRWKEREKVACLLSVPLILVGRRRQTSLPWIHDPIQPSFHSPYARFCVLFIT